MAPRASERIRMMSHGNYDKKYYDAITPGSLQSAKELIPVVSRFINPRSVIDIGCGSGAWLSVWQKEGVKEIFGIDGAYIKNESLLIDPVSFMTADIKKPLQLDKRYDLVMSLEVAEHLPSGVAPVYIESLCRLGDLVLFSAAIPHQGGINHINEQYPEYWIRLFAQHRFSPYDCLRGIIWNNKLIDTCYRQNILFFVHDDKRSAYPAITEKSSPVLGMVHPEHYEMKQRTITDYQRILRSPFHACWYLFKKYVRNILSKAGLWK